MFRLFCLLRLETIDTIKAFLVPQMVLPTLKTNFLRKEVENEKINTFIVFVLMILWVAFNEDYVVTNLQPTIVTMYCSVL